MKYSIHIENEEVALEWADRLESGEYRQGYGRLRSMDGTFCCLGVLCDMASERGLVEWRETEWGYWQCGKEENEGEAVNLPPEVLKWIHLFPYSDSDSLDGETSLVSMNDDLRLPFPEIARVIRMAAGKKVTIDHGELVSYRKDDL